MTDSPSHSCERGELHRLTIHVKLIAQCRLNFAITVSNFFRSKDQIDSLICHLKEECSILRSLFKIIIFAMIDYLYVFCDEKKLLVLIQILLCIY